MLLLGGAGAPAGATAALLVGVLVKLGVLIGTAAVGNLQLKVLLLEVDLLILEVHLLEIQTLM